MCRAVGLEFFGNRKIFDLNWKSSPSSFEPTRYIDWVNHTVLLQPFIGQ